jgi:hypothetical protein
MHAAAESIAPVDQSHVFIMATPAGQAAKRHVLRLASRYQAAGGSYRCIACGKRCEVSVEYDATGNIAHSTGHCRTPDCIAWKE